MSKKKTRQPPATEQVQSPGARLLTGGPDLPFARSEVIALVIVVLLAWAVQTFFLNYTVDDAFISFRYSRNLAQGFGLVFNPGERVEGYTNFLWTVFCAVPFLLGIDVLWFSKIVLMLLSAGVVVVFVLLLRRQLPRPVWWAAFVPALVLALNTSFTVYAVNGIETMLFVFLLLLALLLSAGEFQRGGWLSAIPWALLFFTRPDGAMFFGLTWLARLVWGRRDRSFIIWTAAFAVPALALIVFRLAYFGHLFPNTYYVKGAGNLSDRVSGWGLRYFRDIFKVPANWFYVLAPAVAGLLTWRRLSRFGRLVLVMPYVYLGYVLYIGGDVNFPHFRFMLHVLPVLALVGFLPLTAVPAGRVTRSAFRLTSLLIVGAVLVTLQLGHTRSVWKTMNEGPEQPVFRYGSLMPLATHISIYPEIADSLRRVVPPGKTVVMQDVGAIPYYSGVNTIDIIGLVNGDLAHYFYGKSYTDYLRGRLPEEVVHEVDAYARDYVIERRKAEFVLYHVDSGRADDLRYSFHWHNLAFDPRFAELYEPVMLFSYPGTGRADHLLFRRKAAP
jgi:arabinofuranosyltransferase